MKAPSHSARSNSETIGLRVEGTVQGVGFRPFVYRLARKHDIDGWVLNDVHGVLIQATALPDALARFEKDLRTEAPAAAIIERILRLPPQAGIAHAGFEIRESHAGALVDAPMPADLAVCSDCLREMRDPGDRRHLYPFINCTNCGPRYSIIEKIPYDRPNTTMRAFELCPACLEEYHDPNDRRFHAQPVACPKCGPQLVFLEADGRKVAERGEALRKAIEALEGGDVLAMKGIGGFHLVCDAANDSAVGELRRRKNRDEKPFAIMAPDIDVARLLCEIAPREETLLQSPQAPILLANRRPNSAVTISDAVAPDNPLLGIMLPYSPLHHLLMDEFGRPIVATSANISDEPICIDETEALDRLKGIADGFLSHNRPIARAVDDSVARLIMGEPVILRRARGYAPEPIVAKRKLPGLIATGAHLKNTVAVTTGNRIFTSQHIGDLSTAAACDSFSDAIETLSLLYKTSPEAVACDLHPDYYSTRWAERSGLPVVRVQHHFAHVLAGMADNGLEGPVLGVSWDGTGYGPDGTIWGGEWLLAPSEGIDFERVAHFLQFRIPGGEAAIHRPALTALGLLTVAGGDNAFGFDEVTSVLGLKDNELRVVERMLARGLNAPLTTSAGRLFDGIAALLGLGNQVSFEAQAAIKLEFLAMTSPDSACYDSNLRTPPDGSKGTDNAGSGHRPCAIFDWTPMLNQILDDLRNGAAKAGIARRFHNTLARGIAAVAREIPQYPVVLTGGCFQNKLLTEITIALLRENGLEVYWHHSIPPNDGGIATGQILAAANLDTGAPNAQIEI